MIDYRVPLWLLVAAALIVGLPLLIRLRRDLKLTLAFRALVESDRPPFLIYSERGRLIYRSPGLVLFDKGSAAKIKSAREALMRGEEQTGELALDGNRYYFRSKPLEYKPGKIGAVVYLEYLGSDTAAV